MDTAPRDGSLFVVKQMKKYQHGPIEDVMIVQWDKGCHEEGGWYLPEGALISYEECVGWSPIPQT